MSVKDVGKNKQAPHKEQKETYYLITENGERLTTEKGEAIIIESGIPIVLPTAPELPEQEEAPIYRPMLHGPGLDSLTQISQRTIPERDKISDTALYKGTNYKLTMTCYSKLLEDGGLRVSAQKLLDALVQDLTDNNNYQTDITPNTTAIIDLEAYMKRCGKPLTKTNKDKERRRIKKDLGTLLNILLEWTEHKGKHAEGTDSKGFKNFLQMRICDKVGIANNKIIVNFTPDMASYLTHAYIMWYPDNLLKTDDRNKSTYHIGRKLLMHHSNINNQNRGTANIISIKALLDCTGDIPSEEEVGNSGRQYYQRRILPLIKSLDALVEGQVLINWEICNSKRTPLTKSQQDKQDYDTIINCYIHFEPTDNAWLQKYLEQHKENKKDREEKQAKAKTKQRRSGKPGKE